MAIKKGYIKQKTGPSSSDILLPHTSADIVALASAVSVDDVSTTDVQSAIEELAKGTGTVKRVNGKSPAASDDNLNPHVVLKGDVTIDAADIYLHGNIPASGTAVYSSSDSIQGVLAGLHNSYTTLDGVVVKSVNGETPTSGAVTVYGNIIPATSSNGALNIIDSNGKVPIGLLPDAILGQVMYGGNVTVNFNNGTIAGMTLTSELATMLEVSQTTSTWAQVVSAIKSNRMTQNGGVYFIVAASGSGPYVDTSVNFTSGTNDNTLSVQPGDWVIYDGNDLWNKIDNTDAVTGVKGSAEQNYRVGNIDITPANLGIVLTTTDGSEELKVGTKIVNNTTVDNKVTIVTRESDQTIGGDKTFVNSIIAQDGMYVGKPATSSAAATQAYINFYNAAAANAAQTKTILKPGSATANIDVYLPAIAGTLVVNPTTNNSYAIGSATNNFSNVHTRQVTSNGNLVLAATGGDSATVNIQANGINHSAKLNTENLTSDREFLFPNAGGTFVIGVNSGLKSNGSDSISGSVSTAGVATLGDSGVGSGWASGTKKAAYSCVEVNAKGIVVSGAQFIKVIANGGSISDLATGGIYFEEDAASA